MKLPRTLLRWHVWLGWLIGVPMVLWTVSGLVMTLRPIEDVRGTALRAELAPLTGPAPVLPMLPATGLQSLTLKQTPLGARWIEVLNDETRIAADPQSGLALPRLNQAEAEAAARAYRMTASPIVASAFTPADRPPLDLRQSRPAWGVRFADGARFYIDADTGELLAVRTDFWRFYDFMWGLHIMDLQNREESHHPVIVIFAALAALGSALACVLMARRYIFPARR